MNETSILSTFLTYLIINFLKKDYDRLETEANFLLDNTNNVLNNIRSLHHDQLKDDPYGKDQSL